MPTGRRSFTLSNTLGFFGEILGWATISSVVVLPASIVSGVQFPLLIALLGQAKQNIGKQLGYTYVANTFGSILGSLAGGFGLLPFLSAPGAWRLVVAILVALSVALTLLLLSIEECLTASDAPLVYQPDRAAAYEFHRSHGVLATQRYRRRPCTIFPKN